MECILKKEKINPIKPHAKLIIKNIQAILQENLKKANVKIKIYNNVQNVAAIYKMSVSWMLKDEIIEIVEGNTLDGGH